MPRTIVISHRGSGATGAGSDVTAECHVASAFGGPADLQLLVTAGSVTTVTAKPNRAWDTFDYAAGNFTTGTSGYRWTGGWVVGTPYLRVMAVDTFETYDEGALAGHGGSGWNGGFVVAAY